MTARLVARSAAEADIVDAALWYEQRAPGFGAEFLRAVDVTLAEVVRMPERFPVVYRESRHALLRRFLPLCRQLRRFSRPGQCHRLHTRASQYGWPLGMPLIRKLEPRLWEVRSRLAAGIARVLFTVDGQTMVLLHGFVKKSQKTPAADLRTARQRLADLRKE